MRRLALCSAGTALAAAFIFAQLVWAHDSGFGLARYGPDGALDPSFGSGGVVVVKAAQRGFVANALALQTDGKIVIAGMSSDPSTGSIQLAVARYNADGSADETFSGTGIASTPVGDAGAQASAVALQPDGKILVAGTAFSHGTSNDQFVIVRYLTDGGLDQAFGSDGITTTHVGAAASAAQAIAVQPDGRIVVVGTAYSNGPTDDDFAVARYTPAGQLDTEFGTLGMVTTDFGSDDADAGASLDRAATVALRPDGKIVVAGFTRGAHHGFAVARYEPGGSLDAGFGRGGKVHVDSREPQVFAMAAQASGDLLIAGSAGSSKQTTAPFALLRLRADGTPDAKFGSGGLVTTTFEGSRSGARAITAQPDGKLIVAGAKFGAPSAQGDALPESGFALARYNPDGTVDMGFGAGGKTFTDMGDAGASPLSLAIHPDGKIVAAGLVFFQASAAPKGGPFDAVVRFAAPAAGVGLIIALVVLGRLLRRGKT